MKARDWWRLEAQVRAVARAEMVAWAEIVAWQSPQAGGRDPGQRVISAAGVLVLVTATEKGDKDQYS